MSKIEPSSFRDPDGFVFYKNGQVFRQINSTYREVWQKLIETGFMSQMMGEQILISHEAVGVAYAAIVKEAIEVIRPEHIAFISYPYEWSFEQLKDAALLTLELQMKAVRKGFSLKDATAFNVQFHKGRPVWIDTLSFEIYAESQPWPGYRQFCRHFLAPLALMAHGYLDVNQWSRIYLDGIPLQLASRLLPWTTRLSPGLLMHLHLHSLSENKFSSSDRVLVKSNAGMNLQKMEAILDSLRSTVQKLRLPPAQTEWGNYYEATNYSAEASQQKEDLIQSVLKAELPGSVWDLGANDGRFSRLASAMKIPTVAFDIDPVAVNRNYHQAVASSDEFILPLVTDLTNPSPALGWANSERQSLVARGPVDLVLALALIHHLSITNNLPFDRIAEFFHQCGKKLLIEFVPKDDSQVVRMLRNRKDIFLHYNQDSFEKAFELYFELKLKVNIPSTKRVLYLFLSKSGIGRDESR